MVLTGKKMTQWREIKINVCRLITIKNKTNSSPTHHWCLSWELERSLHYNILISANKDPVFIDLLTEKRGGGDNGLLLQSNLQWNCLLSLQKNEGQLKFKPQKRRMARGSPWCTSRTKRICETCNSHYTNKTFQCLVLLFIFLTYCMMARLCLWISSWAGIWILRKSCLTIELFIIGTDINADLIHLKHKVLHSRQSFSDCELWQTSYLLLKVITSGRRIWVFQWPMLIFKEHRGQWPIHNASMLKFFLLSHQIKHNNLIIKHETQNAKL